MARKSIAKLFNIKFPEQLIFTKNTTESLNLALFGILKTGDHVVTTSMEHNSVLRPLKYMEKSGITHTIVKADNDGTIEPRKIEDAITSDTKLLTVTGASNVTGTKMPIKQLGEIAKKHNIFFMVDGAQLCGVDTLDVEGLNIDILAFPGHKSLLGPLGTGCLYVRKGISIKPLILGGTGTESKNRVQPWDFPEGYESGTINAPGIIGLGYSVKFINSVGIETICFYEKQLISRFDNELLNMDKIKLYGPDSSKKTGVSLFNVVGLESEEVTEILNRDYGICVRGGFHCAGLAHKTIGTWDSGGVRLSVGPFNTRKEIDAVINAIHGIKKRL